MSGHTSTQADDDSSAVTKRPILSGLPDPLKTHQLRIAANV